MRCGSGTTLFVHDALRLFHGTPRATFPNRHQAQEYACRGGHGPITKTGTRFRPPVYDAATTLAYGFGGSRYLAATAEDTAVGPASDECGERWVTTFDLKAAKAVWHQRSECGFDGHDGQDFRVSANGVLIYHGEKGAVFAARPAAKAAIRLSSADTGHITAGDIAVRGDLAYWTETPQLGTPISPKPGVPVVRAFSLGAGRSGAEPQTHDDGLIAKRPGRCLSRRGSTVARTPNVRLIAHRIAGGQKRAAVCRISKASAVSLPAGALSEARIAADRWVLARTGTSATVIDSKRGRVATRVQAAPGTTFSQTTLLDDGTFAWIETAGSAGGRLLAQAPGAGAPVVLAPAAAAPSALASGGSTIYWTAQGSAHRAVSPG